ncbi:MAG: hypothetical protein LQ342_005018 [Letrouitia transgressa]|nr:MAG: hypothetical protein LQ342_005018 [Letrouitia transgressa]
MTDQHQQVDALLTEHFRYTPLSLIDDIINTVNTIIYRAVEAIETGLFSIPPRQLGFGVTKSSGDSTASDVDEEAKAEIENGVHQLETLLESTVDRNFDKFEIYTLRNIFTVPDELVPHIRLSHYEGLNLPLPPNAPTPESFVTLRRKVHETKKLNRALRNIHAQNASLISQLTSLLSPLSSDQSASLQASLSLSFLTSHPAAESLGLSFNFPSSASNAKQAGPLSAQSQFLVTQLPALREAVAALRPKLRTLPEQIGHVDWESRREERRNYIEDRVRKVVGKGVGENPPGLRIGVEEARGLESLTANMGGEG